MKKDEKNATISRYRPVRRKYNTKQEQNRQTEKKTKTPKTPNTMKNLKNYFFSVLMFAAMFLSAEPVMASFELESSAEMIQPPPSEEDVADYVEDRGHDVYYVQPIQGSANFRAYVENGRIIIVYVNNGYVIGLADSQI